jgi:hypothetical protein
VKYVDDVNQPQFASDLACEAARIDLATLKNWASRKPSAVFIADNERVSVGERTSFLFTLRRVLQLAITAELVGLGISPRNGALLAGFFTDIEEPEIKPFRQVGELFPKHYTLLVVHSSTHADVVNAKADEMWRVVLKLGRGSPMRPTAAAIVNLNDIDRRVRSTLGLPLKAREGVVS